MPAIENAKAEVSVIAKLKLPGFNLITFFFSHPPEGAKHWRAYL
jgi:hypothetical protein